MRRIATTVAVLAIIAANLVPLLWGIATSLKPAQDIMSFPPRILDFTPTLEHYRALFARLHLGRALWASAVIAVVTTAIALVLNSMAGYAFAKLPFRGRAQVLRALMAGLVVPAQVGGTWRVEPPGGAAAEPRAQRPSGNRHTPAVHHHSGYR